MPSAPFPANEQQRSAALNSYQILDTATEQDYDELTELAAAICQTSVALISFVEGNRQWFKSHKGTEVTETARSSSFCAYGLLNPEELLEVVDAHADERFQDNPLVTGDPHITFYAGVPLVDSSGNALGSLCVIDTKRRQLSDVQKQALRTLSGQVVSKLESRKKYLELEDTRLQLDKAVEELKATDLRKTDFISIVSHELKTPLTSLHGYVQIIGNRAKANADHSTQGFIEKAQRQIKRMQGLISGFLDVARFQEGKILLHRRHFDMADLIKIAEEESLASITSHKVVFHPVEYTPVFADQDKIEQVIINFLNNAVKYSSAGSEINVSTVSESGTVRVCVQDEGIGIAPENQDQVFERFY